MDNFENCNHSLTLDAIKLAKEMWDAFGNSAIHAEDAGYTSEKHQRLIKELLDQGFLVEDTRNNQRALFRTKQVLGLPPEYRGKVEV